MGLYRQGSGGHDRSQPGEQRHLSADPNNSTVKPSPYVGIQFAAIPEFTGIATEVSQEFSAAYAGQQTVEEALEKAQAITNEAMEAVGYR